MDLRELVNIQCRRRGWTAYRLTLQCAGWRGGSQDIPMSTVQNFMRGKTRLNSDDMGIILDVLEIDLIPPEKVIRPYKFLRSRKTANDYDKELAEYDYDNRPQPQRELTTAEKKRLQTHLPEDDNRRIPDLPVGFDPDDTRTVADAVCEMSNVTIRGPKIIAPPKITTRRGRPPIPNPTDQSIAIGPAGYSRENVNRNTPLGKFWPSKGFDKSDNIRVRVEPEEA